MQGLSITEVEIPDSVDADNAADFLACVEVRSTVWAHDSGSADEVRPADEMLPVWRKQEHEPKRMLLARLDGRPVARAITEYRAGDTSDTAWLHVEVVPEARGRGIGAELAGLAEALGREVGATKFIVYAPCWKVGGPRLAAPTGFGDVAADTAETRLLQRMGYRLEQVERGSRLPLPVAREVIDAMRADAERASEGEYRIHSWTGMTPVHWREDMAQLITRMSIDAPSAGLEEEEDVWTVERLIADETITAEGPSTEFTTVVEHVPSGRLAGFTTLIAPDDMSRPIDQDDTIVLREHRGHRLGMLLKVANIAYVQDARPGHPRIVTYNAEENRHMLSVNEALGFEPFVYEGAWRKDVVGEV